MRVPPHRVLPVAALALCTACSGAPTPDRVRVPFETVSLLGDTLYPPALADSIRDQRMRQLQNARVTYARDTMDAEALIWVGRRAGYLGQYNAAVEAFTLGVERHPEDARFYRHRGHRYITLRKFNLAVRDLERAADLVRNTPDQVEPDGQPNARNIPTSTLQSNIWYHLGLAEYLRGDFPQALRAYQEALRVATNPDMLVATSNWLYQTLRRMGRTWEARAVLRPIERDMDIIENGTYHRLLLMYQGVVPADSLLRLDATGAPSLEDVTTAYGVGNWHRYNGRPQEARRIFRAIVGARDQWAAFGYIAAEAELARGVTP